LVVELADAALPVAEAVPDAVGEADPDVALAVDPEVVLAVDPEVMAEPLESVVEAELDPVFVLELAEEEIVMVTPFARQVEEYTAIAAAELPAHFWVILLANWGWRDPQRAVRSAGFG